MSRLPFLLICTMRSPKALSKQRPDKQHSIHHHYSDHNKAADAATNTSWRFCLVFTVHVSFQFASGKTAAPWGPGSGRDPIKEI